MCLCQKHLILQEKQITLELLIAISISIVVAKFVQLKELVFHLINMTRCSQNNLFHKPFSSIILCCIPSRVHLKTPRDRHILFIIEGNATPFNKKTHAVLRTQKTGAGSQGPPLDFYHS